MIKVRRVLDPPAQTIYRLLGKFHSFGYRALRCDSVILLEPSHDNKYQECQELVPHSSTSYHARLISKRGCLC